MLGTHRDGEASQLLPSHTTVHAGPHTAVRRIERRARKQARRRSFVNAHRHIRFDPWFALPPGFTHCLRKQAGRYRRSAAWRTVRGTQLLLASFRSGLRWIAHLLCPLLTSPVRSRTLLPAQSGSPDTPEISRGKNGRLRRTLAGFTTPTLDDRGLRDPLLARPAG